MRERHLEKLRNRILYIEILRALAIIAVILIHLAASSTITSFDATNIDFWWVHNIFDSLARWCVPVFVMISGALLLNPIKRESIGTFIKKRGIKILIPFIAWGILYISLGANWDSEILTAKYYIKQFIEGPIYYHIWFMYMIAALYAVTPILKDFIVSTDQKRIEYFLLILFFSVSVIEFLQYFSSIQFNYFFSIKPLGGFIGFFILGYYLHTYEVKKLIRYVLYFCALACLVLIPVATYYATMNNGGFLNSYFYEYTNPFVACIASAIFILFKQSNIQPKDKDNILDRYILSVSKYSFGIFLVHPLVIYYLFQLNLTFTSEFFNPLIRIPLTVIIVLFFSHLIVVVLGKIPYVKMIVP